MEPKTQLGHRSRGLRLLRPGETGQDVVRSGIGKMALSEGSHWSWWEALFFSLPLDPQCLGAAPTLEGHRMPMGELE